MARVLIAECMQEISSFNPKPSEYDDFLIQRGDEMVSEQAGTNTALGGVFAVLKQIADITAVPVISARAGSGGLLSAAGWQKLSGEVLSEIETNLPDIDAIYVSLHGAMGAEGELDPEGFLLGEIRRMAGPDIPIVISLDLHGILTRRMLEQVDGLAIYHTYPHVDFARTGTRAVNLLLDQLRHNRKTVIARAVIPALVRGDELVTKTGCYGDLILDCQRLEAEGKVLSAGIMIGNPFTDVPELCSQVIIATDNDPETAQHEAERLAAEFWPNRHRMQGKLVSLDQAIAQARTIPGTVAFTDAADATSSGASGDSAEILRALVEAGYERNVLAQIVDASAAEKAHAVGVGGNLEITLGGTIDPRFEKLHVQARVCSLSDGAGRLETMKQPLAAGPTAVLKFDNFTVVTMSRAVSLFDRAMYYANGLNPRDFDLIVVKSPHTEHHMYDAWVEKNFNIDAPGATSADIPALGHTICARPVFPLDPEIGFEPKAQLFCREVTR